MTEEKEYGYKVGDVYFHKLKGFEQLWNSTDVAIKDMIVNEVGALVKKLHLHSVSGSYEVTFLMAHQDYLDEKLSKMQSEGWQIAGDILIKNEDGHCTHHYFHIPMKRRI